MRIAKSLPIVLTLCAMLLSGCGNSAANVNSAGGNTNVNAQSQTLRVGMECAYAPFNWTQPGDDNGAVKIDANSYAGGYDVEIAKLVAEGLDKELEIVKTEWDGLLPALTSGKIDLIIAGMSPTAERKESIDFTDDYYTSDLVVVVLEDGPYASAKTLKDFSGAKITGQLNTFHYSVIDQMEGALQQTALGDFPTMLTALTSGKIDGYISERPGAMAAEMSDNRITFIVPEPGFVCSPEDVSIAIGLKKGSELTSAINDILSDISHSQRLELMDTAIKNQPLASR